MGVALVGGLLENVGVDESVVGGTRLGVAPDKGILGERRVELDHLGSRLTTLTLRFTVTANKQTRIQKMTGKLLRLVSQGKG